MRTKEALEFVLSNTKNYKNPTPNSWENFMFCYTIDSKDPYTFVRLWPVGNPRQEFIGFAKCNPYLDVFSYEEGERTALRRAAKDLVREYTPEALELVQALGELRKVFKLEPKPLLAAKPTHLITLDDFVPV
jgi:hypothetical protein